MKAAFVHDHRFSYDQNRSYYSNGGLPYRVLCRYLEHFNDGLVVVGRERHSQTIPPSLTIANGPGVEMACVAQESLLSSILRGKVINTVRVALSQADCAIIRLPSNLGLIAAREAIRMRKPWMAEVVGCAWDSLYNHGSITGKVAASPLYLLNRHFIFRAPRALYVTERFLQARYPCTGPTVACSDVMIQARAPEVLDRRASRIDAWSLNAPIVIGIIGSLNVDYKGHETALRAVARLRRTLPQIQLRCLGGGNSDRWKVMAMALGISGQIEFTGILPSGTPVIEWMDNLDLIVTPSLQEGLPRALVEAMSRALPAVGSRTGGIPELLDSSCIHRPKDFVEMAAIIERLVTSPIEMKRCAIQNFEKAGEFDTPLLEARRSQFLKDFANECRGTIHRN